MITRPQQLKFSETANLENGKILVKSEGSISHDPDVDKQTIESKIDEWVERSEENEEVLYFPGTYNEDSGGFFHTTMPAINDGDILTERRKVKPHYSIHDWAEAARQLDMKDEFWLISEAERTLGNTEESYMLSSNAREIDSVLYQDPKHSVKQEVNEVATEDALDTVGTFDFHGYEVLPVICNELSRLELEEGADPDIIVESSYDLPNWEDDYRTFSDENEIESTYILRADGAYPENSGTYQLESGEILEAEL